MPGALRPTVRGEGHAEVLALALASSRRLLDPRLSPSGDAVAMVEAIGPRRHLSVLSTGRHGEPGPSALSLAGPVPAAGHPRGGGLLDWMPDGEAIVFVEAASGALVFQPTNGDPAWPLAGTRSAWSPSVSPDGSRVAYVYDERWVAVAWIGPEGTVPWPVLLGGLPGASSGPEGVFVIDPVWSPDGTSVAWSAWESVTMPFLDARVVLAEAPSAEPGRANVPRPDAAVVVAGGPGVAVGQPRFSPDGLRLGFVSDQGDWPQLWTMPVSGGPAELVVDGRREEDCTPCWGPGQRSWVWSPDGAWVAVAAVAEGFGRLRLLDPSGRRAPVEVGKAMHWALDWHGEVLAAMRSGARTPDAVVVYDLDLPSRSDDPSPRRRVLAEAPPVLPRAVLEEPEVVSFPAPRVEGLPWPGDDPIRARLYRPAGVEGPTPLALWIHGGPTDQARVELNLRWARLCALGWSILVVDHRGSTGWGRAWARALEGRWGVLDVADVAEGAAQAVRRGWSQPKSIVAVGASAGGFTVLHLLAQPDVPVAAGVALYPPSDLADLAQRTHRFERHYNDWLVGPPSDVELLAERSPIGRAAAIAKPLLVLHGTADPVVPFGQSERLVGEIRRFGGSAELVAVEGEGHGWSSPEALRRELDAIDGFLSRVVPSSAGPGSPDR